MTTSDIVKDVIAIAFIQKVIVEGRAALGKRLRSVDRSLWFAWSAASAARVIAAELVPAYDAFFVAVDRANALIEQKIAEGEWDSHPFLAVARQRLALFRAARDEIAALVKRAASRRELLAAVRAAPR